MGTGTVMSSADTFGLLGTLLDTRYRIDKVVGEGGFGIVYRAQQTSFDEPVAVKVLKLPHHLTAEQRTAVIATFRAEGKHLRKLSAEHPSFVRALDTGVFESRGGVLAPYLVLEWLEGEPLETNLTRRRESGLSGRSLGETLALLEPIASALSLAHESKVVHRDIKPANIFLVRTARGITAKLRFRAREGHDRDGYRRPPRADSRQHRGPDAAVRRAGAVEQPIRSDGAVDGRLRVCPRSLGADDGSRSARWGRCGAAHGSDAGHR